MNIFVLSRDPVVSAMWHCDQHIVKMPLETAQMLSTVLSKYGVTDLYKPSFDKHPCTIWSGANRSNFLWLCELGISLCNEYAWRYGKTHKSEAVIMKAIKHADLLPYGELTDFALAMPDEYKSHNDAVLSYRSYYLGEKKKFARYKHTLPPAWYVLENIYLEGDVI